MPARKIRGTKENPMPKEWRDKIRATQIANRLYKCFTGEVELTTEQIRCGEALFKRLEPELSRTDNTTTHKGEVTVKSLDDDALNARLAELANKG